MGRWDWDGGEWDEVREWDGKVGGSGAGTLWDGKIRAARNLH